jgi:hypothetical protein
MHRALAKLSVTVFATSLASLAFGCAPAGGGDEEDSESSIHETDGDATQDGRAIVGGQTATAYPESVLIDMAQGGQLVSICSGVLIGPRDVLTAGHCVYGFDGFVVEAPFVGVTANATHAALLDWANDSESVDPTQHDVALIRLDRDVPVAKYAKVATARLAWGSNVRNVGRIDDGQASWSSLFIGASIKVYDGASAGYPFDYVTNEIIQSGDSGGPVFKAGTHDVVAVNSGGGGGTQVLARVDLVASWIAQTTAAWAAGDDEGGVEPAPEPEDPCGGVTYEGQCATNKKVEWCEGGEVKTMSCTGNKRCGWNGSGGYYDCVR